MLLKYGGTSSGRYTGIDHQRALRAWVFVAHEYRVDPYTLRVDDTIKDLNALDADTYGDGQMSIEEAMTKHGIAGLHVTSTVGDFIDQVVAKKVDL